MDNSNLFNKKILGKKIQSYYFDDNFLSNISIISKWGKLTSSSIFHNENEESLQGDFLNKIFSGFLGYKTVADSLDKWYMKIENKTNVDSKKSDGSLGIYSHDENKTKAVIELKRPLLNLDLRQNRANGKRTPIEQAFDYANKIRGCEWVIVSNLDEIRLYSYTETRMEQYYLIRLNSLSDPINKLNEIKEFYYIFNRNNLVTEEKESEIKKLLIGSLRRQENITKEFYGKYRKLRDFLYEDIRTNNDIDKFIAFEKTQKIMDRFLFIFFAEDKGLLPSGITQKLKEEAKNSYLNPSIWERFKKLFVDINTGNLSKRIEAYNGGLFKEDKTINNLKISEEIIDKIIDLSNYDFSTEVGVYVLGHIFEQTIADIEDIKNNFEKIENIKKRDGIYYTPEFITKYIVENSVGKWIEERKTEVFRNSGLKSDFEPSQEEINNDKRRTKKTSYKQGSLTFKYLNALKKLQEKILEIKILDPACGSGAFLIQALSYLVEVSKDVNKRINSLDDNQIGLFDPTNSALKNCIYGVDKNKESVEITKLSLWLNSARQGEKLTNLDSNIKSGDSLLSTEFNWEEEYPDIFKNGGFDIVIGNPPYIQLQRDSGKLAKKYKEENYKTHTSTGDIYCLFYEKGYQLLKRNKGILGYITSNKWMRAAYGKKLRGFFINNTKPLKLVDFTGHKIFEDATVDTNLFFFRKMETDEKKFNACLIQDDFINKTSLESYVEKNNAEINKLSPNSWIIISNEEQRIKEKIEKFGTPLKNWDISINYGIKTGFNEAFIIDGNKKDELIRKDPRNSKIIKPLLRGKDIKKYKAEFADKWLINTHNGHEKNGIYTSPIDVKNNYPIIKVYLNNYLEEINKRYDKGITPYNLRNCAYLDEFEKEKIIYNVITKKSSFYFDKKNNYYTNNKCYIVTGNNLHYLVSFLNSNLFFSIFKNNFPSLGKKGRELRKVFMLEIPVMKYFDENEIFKDLVLSIEDNYNKFIENTMDIIVYKLYELTYEEIKIIDSEIEKIITKKEYERKTIDQLANEVLNMN
ncbi:MAG: hypothetical protein PWQ77_1579 [Kosmotogales bacterium]|nr:hypothetical protein [Kosmotogales bacterium]